MNRSRRINSLRPLSLIAPVVVALVGCGSGSGTVPSDLVGERLDVAEHELDKLSLGYDEVGGGIAGIVVKSNWTVCQTKPGAGQPVSGNIELIVDRVCSSSGVGTANTPTPVSTPANTSSVTFEGQGLMSAEQYLFSGNYHTSFDSCAKSAIGNDLQNAADNQYGTFIRLNDGGTASIRFKGNYILFLNVSCDWHVTFTPE